MNYLVIDCGLYIEQADALSDNGKNKVRYWTNWEVTQKFEDYSIGKGFRSLEKILYLADHFEWADCIVNFDVRYNDLIVFLKKIYPNKSIFGSGHAAKLEHDRWKLKKVIRDIELPLHKAVKLKGLTELSSYLKENNDKFVKINIFRDDVESFYAKDYNSIKTYVEVDLPQALGPCKEEFEFIVEDCIHSDVEVGFDGFFNGVDYLKPYLVGYEYKKELYIARVTNDLPSQLKETMDAFLPVFRKLDYRGGLSTEEKIVSKKEHYFLDLCARFPSPSASLYSVFINNFSEVVYKVGLKQSVKLDIKYKYLAALPLNTPHAKDHWVDIDFDKKHKDNITFGVVTEVNKQLFIVKNHPLNPIVIVAGGNTVDEVLEILKKYSEEVNAFGLNKDIVGGIDHIKGKIDAGKKLGIDF